VPLGRVAHRRPRPRPRTARQRRRPRPVTARQPTGGPSRSVSTARPAGPFWPLISDPASNRSLVRRPGRDACMRRIGVAEPGYLNVRSRAWTPRCSASTEPMSGRPMMN